MSAREKALVGWKTVLGVLSLASPEPAHVHGRLRPNPLTYPPYRLRVGLCLPWVAAQRHEPAVILSERVREPFDRPAYILRMQILHSLFPKSDSTALRTTGQQEENGLAISKC